MDGGYGIGSSPVTTNRRDTRVDTMRGTMVPIKICPPDPNKAMISQVPVGMAPMPQMGIPDFNEQVKRMQEQMQAWQSQFPAMLPPPAFPAMQPFPAPISPGCFPVPQETKPQVDSMGFFRLMPTPEMAGFPSPSAIAKTPLEIPDVVVQCKDGSKKFLLKYDVSDFKPGEVHVQVEGDQLQISGNHEEISQGTVIKRTYHKEHPLPPGLRRDQLRSVLSPEGVLTIQAPIVGDYDPRGTGTLTFTTSPSVSPSLQPAVTQPGMYRSSSPSTSPHKEKRRVKFTD